MRQNNQTQRGKQGNPLSGFGTGLQQIRSTPVDEFVRAAKPPGQRRGGGPGTAEYAGRALDQRLGKGWRTVPALTEPVHEFFTAKQATGLPITALDIQNIKSSLLSYNGNRKSMDWIRAQAKKYADRSSEGNHDEKVVKKLIDDLESEGYTAVSSKLKELRVRNNISFGDLPTYEWGATAEFPTTKIKLSNFYQGRLNHYFEQMTNPRTTPQGKEAARLAYLQQLYSLKSTLVHEGTHANQGIYSKSEDGAYAEQLKYIYTQMKKSSVTPSQRRAWQAIADEKETSWEINNSNYRNSKEYRKYFPEGKFE